MQTLYRLARRIALGISLVAVSVAPTMPAYAAVNDADYYFLLKNRSTGTCLSVWSGAGYDGAPATEATCNTGNRDQHWGASSANKNLTNRWHSDKCLSLAPGAITDGIGAVLWECDGGPRQDWNIYNEGGHVQIFSPAARKCLAFRRGDQAPRQARVFGCVDGYQDQDWYAVYVS
jgi:hypothetical protein